MNLNNNTPKRNRRNFCYTRENSISKKENF